MMEVLIAIIILLIAILVPMGWWCDWKRKRVSSYWDKAGFGTGAAYNKALEPFKPTRVKSVLCYRKEDFDD